MSIDFNLPQVLALLPLALLPLIPRIRDSVAFSSVSFLPEDGMGKIIDAIWRAFAIITISALLVGIAGPGQSESQIERIGRGAELSILMDRSASMDAYVRRVGLKLGEQARPSISKNSVVRESLSWLVKQRPQNRYALSVFNVAPIHVAPFSDDSELVLAGLEASGYGRGPNKTNMGMALLSSIERFNGRSYTGSRAILLVSDGGAKLGEDIQQRISEGLKRNRINLYFIYIQSDDNSPDLESVGVDADATLDEVALHIFFKGLDTDYRVYQANDPESMAQAIAEIDQQQNLPLSYFEKIPRIDYSHWFYLGAALSCLILSVISMLKLEHL
ncbi:MAG: VWA domain-containing protein [Granulosicoccus sp.]